MTFKGFFPDLRLLSNLRQVPMKSKTEAYQKIPRSPPHRPAAETSADMATIAQNLARLIRCGSGSAVAASAMRKPIVSGIKTAFKTCAATLSQTRSGAAQTAAAEPATASA